MSVCLAAGRSPRPARHRWPMPTRTPSKRASAICCRFPRTGPRTLGCASKLRRVQAVPVGKPACRTAVTSATHRRAQPAPPAEAAPPAELPAHVQLGQRLKQRRVDAGLTLAGLAERAGFGKAYLSRIENGKKVPPIGTLARIADVLGI